MKKSFLSVSEGEPGIQLQCEARIRSFLSVSEGEPYCQPEKTYLKTSFLSVSEGEPLLKRDNLPTRLVSSVYLRVNPL